MIKFYLQLKSWQLFSISWGLLLALVADLYLLGVIGLDERYRVIHGSIFLVLFLLGSANSFAWVFSIGNGLSSSKRELLVFNFLFWIPTIFYWFIALNMADSWFFGKRQPINLGLGHDLIFELIVIWFYVSIACALLGLAVAARRIKCVELGRNPMPMECISEHILLILAPIGIWILQPRVNKLVNSRDEV